MLVLSILWLFVWGGIFTDIGNLSSPKLFSNTIYFIQGARSLLPLFVVFICLIWILALRFRFTLHKSTVGFLFLYCLMGMLASLFVSPQPLVSFYWGALYLSPLLVVIASEQQEDSLQVLQRILLLNYIIVLLIFAMLTPQTIQIIRGSAPFLQFYNMPFGLGEVRVNGVGRYALIVAIISFVRISYVKQKLRFLWLIPLSLALVTLAYTRSRTSLLGLGVASMVFVYTKGINLRFFIIGPITAYILYLSGYKWRAQQHVENLIGLTGREYTWMRGLSRIKESPLFGYGFHADRLMIDSEHMHNTYLHAMIQSGILGGILMLLAMLSILGLIIKTKLFKVIRHFHGKEKIYLVDSVMIICFFIARSLFESTAAFYGVDLLFLVPAVAYVFVWTQKNIYNQEAPAQQTVRAT